jgi:hypothetical protein
MPAYKIKRFPLMPSAPWLQAATQSCAFILAANWCLPGRTRDGPQGALVPPRRRGAARGGAGDGRRPGRPTGPARRRLGPPRRPQRELHAQRPGLGLRALLRPLPAGPGGAGALPRPGRRDLDPTAVAGGGGADRLARRRHPTLRPALRPRPAPDLPARPARLVADEPAPAPPADGAFLRAIPLDLYAYDTPESLRRFDQRERLLVILDRQGRLAAAFPERVAR